MTTTVDLAPQAQLMQFFTAKWVLPTIGVLAELDIADHLADGPRTPEDLAASSGADPGALYRLLRAAASVDVFVEDDEGRFGLTPMAQCLRTDVSGSLRAAAIMFTRDPFWRPYAHVMHSARTGTPAFDAVFGADIYTYLAQDTEDAQLFQAAAIGFYAASTGPVVRAYDFSRFSTVIDLGGGIGFLLAAILEEHPHLSGVLLERPHMLAEAREVFAGRGLGERVELVDGDFFDTVPAGGDVYVIKSCLHNFRDARAIEVLRVIRRTIPEGAPLLVVEGVVPAGNEPHYTKFDDVEMLVVAGGVDRRADQWATLLSDAGFQLSRIIPATGMVSVLEAHPR